MVIMKIVSGIIVGLSLITFMIIPEPASSSSCDALQVYHKCVQTAYQNYQDGLYDRGTYYDFVGDHCKDAGRSCLD